VGPITQYWYRHFAISVDPLGWVPAAFGFRGALHSLLSSPRKQPTNASTFTLLFSSRPLSHPLYLLSYIYLLLSSCYSSHFQQRGILRVLQRSLLGPRLPRNFAVITRARPFSLGYSYSRSTSWWTTTTTAFLSFNLPDHHPSTTATTPSSCSALQYRNPQRAFSSGLSIPRTTLLQLAGLGWNWIASHPRSRSQHLRHA